MRNAEWRIRNDGKCGMRNSECGMTDRALLGKRERDVEDLKERMKRFGLAIIQLAEKLPAGRAAGVVACQIIKSGTSVGANYRAACRARSRADFVSKMGIVEEELDETLYWLEVSLGAGFLSQLTHIPQSGTPWVFRIPHWSLTPSARRAGEGQSHSAIRIPNSALE